MSALTDEQLQQAYDSARGGGSVDRLRAVADAAVAAEREKCVWFNSKTGDYWPSIGEKYLIIKNGILQEAIFEFDQGDDGFGGGDYFWSHEELDECPVFDSDNDLWVPLNTLTRLAKRLDVGCFLSAKSVNS